MRKPKDEGDRAIQLLAILLALRKRVKRQGEKFKQDYEAFQQAQKEMGDVSMAKGLIDDLERSAERTGKSVKRTLKLIDKIRKEIKK